jgi:hypothetical protein
VPWGGTLIKYGVVEEQALNEELTGWRQMFLAGRMHKPVLTLCHSPQVEAAQAANLRSALSTALLLLPSRFSSEALLTSICSLSYDGDIRMGLAEDAKKVQRIVSGSWQGLEDMYITPLKRLSYHRASKQTLGSMSTQNTASQEPLKTTLLNECSKLFHDTPKSIISRVSDEVWEQDMSYMSRLRLMQTLPVGVLHEISRGLRFQVPESHLVVPELRDHILGNVLNEGTCEEYSSSKSRSVVASALRSIVRRCSMYQAMSGALASGWGKAWRYSLQKVRKAAWWKKSIMGGQPL